MMRPFRTAGAGSGAALLAVLVAGCQPSDAREAEPPANSTAGTARGLFVDAAAPAGIRFVHSSGAKGKFYFIENTPAGCAFVDYDNDGFLDIVLIQSGSSEPTEEVMNRPHCALYRNQRNGTFVDATRGSGLDRDLGYGQGIAVGDYDNDGFEDLFITAYGGCHLLRNTLGEKGLPDRSSEPGSLPIFQDVTRQMGLDRPHGSGYATSAAFGDYDNDGRLDLYVCYYSDWSWGADRPCADSAGRKEYCTPEIYEPETHRLYHNGGGRFEDVSDKAGISRARGRGLSVVFLDYNGDGRQDIFVANDLTPNMLWRGNRDSTFTEVALEAGCAYDGSGALLAGMGIGVADYDHSGRESLFVGNFSDKPNTLYRNTAAGIFRDESIASGLAVPHMKFLTFGCEFMDYDADGWPDLFVVNGHVQVHADERMENVTYKERKQLFRNTGDGAFRELTSAAEMGDLMTPTVGRGMAAGDYDNDGRLDALVNNQNGAAQLFRNRDGSGNHWIEFLTIGTKSNRDGRHAHFTLSAGGVRQTAVVRAGSSYLSHSDRRVYFGLGQSTKADSVEIRWPSGARERLTDLAADTGYVVTEGRGVTGKLPAAARKPE